jgi:hypothetical protein
MADVSISRPQPLRLKWQTKKGTAKMSTQGRVASWAGLASDLALPPDQDCFIHRQ